MVAENTPAQPTAPFGEELQLIADGDGLAVIGEPGAVERFLATEGLTSTDLGLPRLGSVLATTSGLAQAGSEVAASSGRWVKLTKESARLVEKYGLRESSASGLATGVIKGEKGQVAGFVEFARGSGALLTNPAVLAGAAGIMAQLAMQQTMDEITDYLAVIDAKVDDVLRNQKDAVLADMIGTELVIDEAMTVRAQAGRVSDVTWSKVQATSMTIARTQVYALRQLDALAEKLERTRKVGDLADLAEEAEPAVREWLAVLARCFQLSDAVAVLELDRVLDSSPQDLDSHRLALRTARRNRRDLIAAAADRLVARLDAAAGAANSTVLLHPTASPALVRSRNDVVTAVAGLHTRLGIEQARGTVDARRWLDAASDVKDKVLETGEGGVDAARRLGTDALGRARTISGRVVGGVGERARRRRGDPGEGDA